MLPPPPGRARRGLLPALLAAALGAAAAVAREVPITILCTTDLHGHVLPVATGPGGRSGGGLLRCATLIDRLRSERPNVLLLDCGDLLQGGAESRLTGGRIMTRALEWLRYDAWVLGNHDFDWGLEALGARHDETSLPILAANVHAREGTTCRLGKVRPYLTITLDGVKVAVVGLTTPAVPSWLRPEMLGGLQFTRSVEALKDVLPRVRAEEPDVMVLAVHQGCQSPADDDANEVRGIAKAFPEFDVMLGGHLHDTIPSAHLNGVLYVQAGCHGLWLARVDLVYDTVRRRVVRKEAVLLPVTDATPPLAALEEELHAELENAAAHLAQEVGRAACDMPATAAGTGQCPVQQLIARAMAEAVDAEVVLHGILAEGVLAEGPVRIGDLWRIVPYENRIGTMRLTAGELREILEENARQLGSVHFMGVLGLAYDLCPGAPPGRRVRNLRLRDGTRLHARRRLRVAASSYVLASGGGRFPVLRRIAEQPTSRLEMTDIDTRTAVIDYVRKHSPVCLAADEGVRLVRGK